MAKMKVVLVRCPNWTGDIVMATPVFRCLRRNFPEAQIIACVRNYAQGILRDNRNVDEILPCDDKSISGVLETSKKIKACSPDTTLLLPNSFKAWLEARLGNSHTIYGYRRGPRKLVMPHGAEPKRNAGQIVPLPMTEYYLNICRQMGLKETNDESLELGVSEKLQAAGDDILRGAGVQPHTMFIGLNPGASFGSSKCWDVDNFARLAELLQQEWLCPVVLFGSPKETGITREIQKRTNADVVDTAALNIDLEYLKPLIRRCSLLITNDTGPRHYAVAFGVPVVVIMGPTNPAYTASNLDKTAVVRVDVQCGPCHKKICPRDHRCMTRISPENVLNEAKKLMHRLNR